MATATEPDVANATAAEAETITEVVDGYLVTFWHDTNNEHHTWHYHNNNIGISGGVWCLPRTCEEGLREARGKAGFSIWQYRNRRKEQFKQNLPSRFLRSKSAAELMQEEAEFARHPLVERVEIEPVLVGKQAGAAWLLRIYFKGQFDFPMIVRKPVEWRNWLAAHPVENSLVSWVDNIGNIVYNKGNGKRSDEAYKVQ